MMPSAEFLKPLWHKLFAVAPKAALVLLVLLAGLVLSWLARRVARWVTRKSGLEALAEKAGVARLLYFVGAKKGLADLAGRLAWFAVLLLTISAVADILELKAVAALMALAIRYLPRLLAASAVLLGGVALASVVRNLLQAFGRKRDDLDAPDFVAKLAYYVILVVSITLAAEQAGVETGIVDALIVITVGIGLGSLALSFALGARPVFHNLAARHYYERLIRRGDRIQIGEHQGVVLRASPVALVLQVERGKTVLVPWAALLSAPLPVEALHDSPSADGDDREPPPARDG